MVHPAMPAFSSVPDVPTLFGAPVEFFLFGAMLLGVALFKRHTLLVSVTGLVVILAFQIFFGAHPTGQGWAALGEHAAHEWVTITNLFLLLVGFEILSHQFEESNLPDHMPHLLPNGWQGGLALLGIVFVLSGFLDNIASAVLGGVMARHVYKRRVSVAFLVGIVAASNAGGAGSVIGDTTTTIMWLNGVSPFAVFEAYIAAVVAFCIFAPLAARAQERYEPILVCDEPDHPLQWRRILIVVLILASAVSANVAANILSDEVEIAPWMGMALWAAISVTSRIAKPDWSVAKPAVRGALFLCSLVAAASLMPVRALPDPSWETTLGIGFVSSVFDNIPLTVLALTQDGYDWALLAFAVGFGGSMVWFGSSAGVALTNEYPEGRSVIRWIREGWFVPFAYVIGFFVMLALLGWNPTMI